MSKEPKKDLLQNYVERVIALRVKQQERLSAEDLKGIALELGMSEEDLAHAEAEATAHLERGQGYLRHQRWDDAIKELSDAVSLSPNRLEAVHALALAYTERWKSSKKEADREEARQLARHSLELDPKHEPSFTLLNTLDNKIVAPSQQTSVSSTQTPKAAPARLTALAGVILLGVGGLAGMALLAGEPAGSDMPREPRITEAFEPPQIAQPRHEPEATPPVQEDVDDIPVEFVPSEKVKGLTWSVRGSRLDNYTDVSYYKLKGELKHEGNTEITELKLKVELLNEEGKVISTEIDRTLGKHQAPIRPGDVHPFRLLEKTTPALRKVRLSVQTVTQEPAPSRYPAAKPVEVTWEFEKPETFSIAVRERASHFTNYSIGDSFRSAYHKLHLEIENTGEATIHTLQLQISFLDRQGNVTSTAEPYILISDEPSLLPGQIRTYGSTHEVTKDFGGYRLSVISAE